ncbi:MAG: Ig-like domain-containing protein [Myxococcota bacterium]
MDWVGLARRAAPLVAACVPWFCIGEAAAERTVFINLGSVALNSDNNQDPTTDSYSSNGFTPGTASGYALTPEEQAELLFYLKEAGSPFDLQFVFERPAAGTYDMVVFGSEADANALFADSDCPPAIGLADCGDGSGPNISFVFQGCLPAAQQTDMRRIAYFSLTGLGFGWGLENESTVGQIMGTYSVFGLQFGNECAPIVNGSCPEHPGCAAGTQNATADLNVIIGARVDDGPPVVTITEPMDGATIGDSFTIAANVDDAFGGLTVEMSTEIAGQSVVEERPEPPYTWDLNGVPPGTWTLNVNATDADGNLVTSSVTVTVDGEGAETTESEGGDSTGDAPDSTTGDDPSDTADPSTSGAASDTDVVTTADPEGTSGDEDGSGGSAPIDPTVPATPADFGAGGTGCQCTSGGDGGPGWALLGLFGLLSARARGRGRRGRTSTRPSQTSSRRDRTSR